MKFDYKEYLFMQNGFTLKDKDERNKIIIEVNERLENLDIDFNSAKFIKKNGRSMAIFEDFTAEKTICNYMTDILNNKYMIKYPNRNIIMQDLFDNIKSLKNINDFTIYRFDFKKYFSSINTAYAVDFLKNDNKLNANEISILENFGDTFQYLPIGVSISNAIAELFGSKFDEKLISNFGKKNIIFYSRFIDDGFILINSYLNKKKIDEIMKDTIDCVFYRKELNSYNLNKVKLNRDGSKNTLVHRRFLNNESLSYLGYKFEITQNIQNNSLSLKYGITDEKQKKMIEKYMKIFNSNKCSSTTRMMFLYNHSRRIVYRKGNSNSGIWINKGITYNYGLLPYYINNNKLQTDLIIKSTDDFLKNFFFTIYKSWNPSEIGVLKKPKYDMRFSIAYNSAIIYNQAIGMSYSDLEKKAMRLSKLGSSRKYDEILSNYLIDLRLGY